MAKTSEQQSAYGRAYYLAHQDAARARTKSHYRTHRSECLRYARAYYLAHKAVANARTKAWAQAHPEKTQTQVRAWVITHPERRKAIANAYVHRHPDKLNAITAKRRASKLQRTPVWANRDAIGALYVEAARLTRETGVKHVVDHVYPLLGRTVSGLHVEANLQILTALANAQKGNKHPDRMAV